MLTADSTRSLRQALARLGKRHLRRNGLSLATIALALAVVVFAVLPAVRGGGRAPGVVHRAAYTFSLPPGYRVLSTATASGGQCAGARLFNFGRPGSPPSRPSVTFLRNSTIATAASLVGGCIALALLPAYTPTATQPDPEASVPPPSSSAPRPTRLRVAGHVAYLQRGTTPPPPGVAPPSGGISAKELFVELPLPDGRQRDLLASTITLSAGWLVAIVREGLAAQ